MRSPSNADERIIRQFALDKAIDSFDGRPLTTEAVLARAEDFRRFLNGEIDDDPSPNRLV